MEPWLELLVVAVTALVAVLAARTAAGSRWWPVTTLAGLAGIVILLFARRWPTLGVEPLGWLLPGIRQHLVLAVALPLCLLPLAARLPRSRDRRALGGLALLGTAWWALAPVAAGALWQVEHRGNPPRQDLFGVHLQRGGYTCGPAAAVTACALLGVATSEDALARAGRTTPWWGTPLGQLADAVRSTDPDLLVTPRAYASADELLPDDGIHIAMVALSAISDHYVVVLARQGDEALVADPLRGLRVWRWRDLERRFRGVGLALRHPQRSPPRLPGFLPGGRMAADFLAILREQPGRGRARQPLVGTTDQNRVR